MRLPAGNASGLAPTALALQPLTGSFAFEILEQLADRGVVPIAELERSIPGASRRTLSRQAKALSQHGAVERLPLGEHGVPGPCLSLSPAGRELAEVARLLDELLRSADLEALGLSERKARSHVVGLIRCGWGTSFLPRIAAGGRSVAEVYEELMEHEPGREWLEVPPLNDFYRLASELCAVGLLEARHRGSPKELSFTELGTSMISGLLGAYRCELRHFSERLAALDPVFVTASFRLVLAGAPLDKVEPGTYELRCKDRGLPSTGVNFEIGAGGQISYRPLGTDAYAVAVATTPAWVESVTQSELRNLSIRSGDHEIVRMIAALAITVDGAPGSAEGEA